MAREIILIDHVKRLEIEEDRLPIFEALLLLEDVNAQMVRNKTTGSCRIRIYNHKNLLLHSTNLQFPLDCAIEEVISRQYPLTKSNKNLLTKNKKVLNLEQFKQSGHLRKKIRCFIQIIKRLWFIGVVIVSFSIFAKLTSHYFFEKTGQKDKVVLTKKQKWQKLVEEQEYFKAAKRYPKKRYELVDYLTKKQEFTWLKEINEYFPTKDAQFDLAFFDKKWQKVIATAPENLSDKRRTMLAFAYLELNKFAEAKILNKYLASEELTEKLDQAYLKQGISFLKEKKVAEAKKSLTLFQKEEVKRRLEIYIEHATIVIDFIELYQKNQDQENYLLWEQRLKKNRRE